ncbi:MAG: hypothetical protein EWV41_10205 [Microcystis wesenbergii Mw_MB_S_20031200_S109]|nr:MAG: hypothetical protein EWV41_10205 [Microcystis wesenbergii Mw_MB_S_20031200_S109]
MIGLQKIEPGKNTELRVFNSFIQWRVVGETTWTNLIPLADITGPQGPPGIQSKNIELQATLTHIQWRLVGDSNWTNLIPLADITGPQGLTGIQGPQGEPSLPPDDVWHIPIPALTENDLRLEGTAFPKALTITSPLPRQMTINKLFGLVNNLSFGSAVISIQYGVTSFTTITGLSALNCTTSILADQIASANNVIPVGNRIRVLFHSISGTLNLVFSLNFTEAL